MAHSKWMERSRRSEAGFRVFCILHEIQIFRLRFLSSASVAATVHRSALISATQLHFFLMKKPALRECPGDFSIFYSFVVITLTALMDLNLFWTFLHPFEFHSQIVHQTPTSSGNSREWFFL